MNQAKRSAQVVALMDAWYNATKAADTIKRRLQEAINAEAPFKIGDVVAVTYPGYNINIGKRPVTFPAEIHKGKVAAIFSNARADTIEYAVSPALFSGGYAPEKRLTVTASMKIEPWNSHHQYLVKKVLAERKRNGKPVRKRASNSTDRAVVNPYSPGQYGMGSLISPFLRSDWRQSREWRDFAFPDSCTG